MISGGLKSKRIASRRMPVAFASMPVLRLKKLRISFSAAATVRCLHVTSARSVETDIAPYWTANNMHERLVVVNFSLNVVFTLLVNYACESCSLLKLFGRRGL